MGDSIWVRILAALDSARPETLILTMREAIELLSQAARDRWCDRWLAGNRESYYDDSRYAWMAAINCLNDLQREKDGSDPVSYSLDKVASLVGKAVDGNAYSTDRRISRKEADTLIELFRRQDSPDDPLCDAKRAATNAMEVLLYGLNEDQPDPGGFQIDGEKVSEEPAETWAVWEEPVSGRNGSIGARDILSAIHPHETYCDQTDCAESLVIQLAGLRGRIDPEDPRSSAVFKLEQAVANLAECLNYRDDEEP